MTELAIRETSTIATERDIVDGWITVAADVSKLADYICETDFVPKGLRNKPAAIAACILTGRELGIGPMASLKSIHMVQGVPSLSAEYKRARALAAGHQIVIDESTSSRCVVRGRRAGSEAWVTITWTKDHADRAKISNKDVWKQYPQRMLQARATSELCDLLFPDATLGLETTEVLEDGGALAIAVGVQAAEETTPEPAKPAARTARRRTAAPQTASPAPQTPPADDPPSPPARSAGEAPMPPLPDEEDSSGPAVPDETPGSGPAAGPDPTTSGASSSAHAPDSSSQTETGEPSPSSPDGSASEPPVNDLQLKAIWTALNRNFGFGSDEKDQARAVCAHIVSHPLASSKDLTKNEAKAVLDTLASWQDVAEKHEESPRAFLIELMATASGEGDGDA